MAMIGEWRSALTLLREAEAQAREGGDDAPARRDAFRSTLLASALVHLGDDLSRGNASEACAHFRSAEAASGGAEFASATVREGRARCALAAATANGNNSPPPPLLPPLAFASPSEAAAAADGDAADDAAHGAAPSSTAWRAMQRTYLQRHARFTKLMVEGGRGAWWKSDAKLKLIILRLPDVGIGNQVAAVASAMLLAMLTDRVLLLHPSTLAKHPWTNLETVWRLPGNDDASRGESPLGGVGDEEKDAAAGRSNATWTRMVWLWSTALPRIAKYDRIERLSSYDFLLEEHYKMNPPFLASLACGNLSTHWTRPFAFLHTNLNLFRLIEQNPVYAPTLRRAFPNGGAVFPSLVKFVLRPTAPVRRAVDAFDAIHLAPARRANRLIVGVHLRVGMSTNAVDVAKGFYGMAAATTEAARVCVKNTVLVRERGATRPPPYTAPVADEGAATKGDARVEWDQATVLVATDSSAIRKMGRAKFSSVEGVSNVVSFDGILDEESAVGLQAAMVELVLLSRCDVIVRAGKMNSLFSGTAAALMATPRQPIYWAAIDAKTFVQCSTMNGIQPCGVTVSVYVCVYGFRVSRATPLFLRDALT